MSKLSKMTLQEIYLEWANDWLTVKRMAEHYGLPRFEMMDLINRGKELHESQFKTVGS